MIVVTTEEVTGDRIVEMKGAGLRAGRAQPRAWWQHRGDAPVDRWRGDRGVHRTARGRAPARHRPHGPERNVTTQPRLKRSYGTYRATRVGRRPGRRSWPTARRRSWSRSRAESMLRKA